ncbi:MBL fold metallo-hydrolase [Thermodesulfobacteriota bacterium]
MKVFDNLYAFLWNNPTSNNCNTFLIRDEKIILIDPGHDHLFGHVEESLADLSIGIQDIDVVFISHGHPDHIEAARRFDKYSTTILLSSIEMDFIRDIFSHYGSVSGDINFESHTLLGEGDLKVGNMEFQVVHTPGHSPGSLCLYWKDKSALFSGDVIFSQGLGRTDLPGGSGQMLKDSIKSLSRLPVNYLLPGHGEIILEKSQVESNFEDIERTWFAYL